MTFRQQLSPAQRHNAITIATQRYAQCQTWGTAKPDAHYRADGIRVGNLDDQIKGAVAEYAFGVMLDYVPTFTPYDPTANDVLGYEIRATFHTGGHLITKPTDKTGLYVLGVVDQAYWFVDFHGWRRYRETVINLGRLAACPTRYATPQTELWPLDMLPATPEYVSHRSSMVEIAS